ncbi:unnamed protein product [Bursaphelenchus xylophilus]|uniref:(pine wood nematode) hypothetical protein n=1 Tax=Bursaphelenchus xylophilus TaxID=6326 RepID=A0A1I7RLR6_BURXY|nr:unnamed protein product [Bursaphelenchus xylophilus]CAG9082655.1 unnamed protein product [Bursaphelenchus xylophilus]
MACSPGAALFQAQNANNRCVQCKPIFIQPGCESTFHDKQFACAIPIITYSLARQDNCGRASVHCNSLDFKTSNAQVLVQVKDLSTNETTWTPIGAPQQLSTQVVLRCGNESVWNIDTTPDQLVSQPVLVRCAHSVVPSGNEIDEQIVDVLEGSGEE